jgi:hypothetical protein
MSGQQRRDDLGRLESLNRELVADAPPPSDHWSRLEATAQPTVDAAGRPAWRVLVRETQVEIGLARSNIVHGSESTGIARQLLLARLREELRRTSVKTSKSIVDNDLSLLEQLGKLEERERASRGSDEGEMETASRLR